MGDYYKPIFRKQIGDPTTTRDSYICTMSAGAMALDYHTKGRIQVWGGELEKHQDDHVGGTDLNDLKQAWAYYGETLEIRTGRGWDAVLAALKEGRGVVLQGDYDQMGSYSCQSNFLDNHAIYLNPSAVQWAISGDSLCSGWKSLSVHVAKAYAEKLNQNVYFAVTAARSPLSGYSVRVIEEFSPARHFSIAAGSTIKAYDPDRPGSVVKTMTFSNASGANASNISNISWDQPNPPVPYGTFLLVENGAFAGLYIPASAVKLDIPTDCAAEVEAVKLAGAAEVEAVKLAGAAEVEAVKLADLKKIDDKIAAIQAEIDALNREDEARLNPRSELRGNPKLMEKYSEIKVLQEIRETFMGWHD